jgi:NADH:ubiquinone oxidoreductase subunit 6 (subunit J)
LDSPSAIADVAFAAFALAAIAFGVMAVSLRNIFYCALSLIGVIFSTSALFVLLGADFLAVVQVLVYVGAIVVLFLFSIVLTERIASRAVKQTNEQKTISAVLGAAVFVIVAYVAVRARWPVLPVAMRDATVGLIGENLLTTYLEPFEVASVLLLAALVGAVVLARERSKK